MQIMRRDMLGKSKKKQRTEGLGADSGDPSTTPSETAGDSDGEKDGDSRSGSVSAKDKANMTREEREAAYEAARARIFKDFKEPEILDGEKGEDGISRSSSVAGKEKVAGKGGKNGKEWKNRFDKDKQYDPDFQARSEFIPGYNFAQPSVYGTPAFPGAVNNPYGSFAMQQINSNNQQFLTRDFSEAQHRQHGYPQQYFQAVGQQYATPQHPFMGPGSQGFQGQGMGQMPFPQSPQQSSPHASFQQATPTMQQRQMSSQAGSQSFGGNSRPTSQQSNQQWIPGPQAAFQAPFQGQPQQAAPNSMGRGAFTPAVNSMNMPSQQYPFGALPLGTSDGKTKPAHPVPGSFNRHNLNPQSNAFVPGGPPSIQHNHPNSMPHMNAPGLTGPYASVGRGMPMHRQGSNQSIPSNYGSPQLGSANPNFPQIQPGIYQNHGMPSYPAQQYPNPPHQTSISKWGTPPNLPAKPPPTSFPAYANMQTNMQHSLPPQPGMPNNFYQVPPGAQVPQSGSRSSNNSRYGTPFHINGGMQGQRQQGGPPMTQ
jgi:SUZ domain